MAAEPDPIELAAEDAADQALVEPLTTPIEQLVDRAASLEQIRDQLLELADAALDLARVTETIARATFSARLSGDAAIGRETGKAPA